MWYFSDTIIRLCICPIIIPCNLQRSIAFVKDEDDNVQQVITRCVLRLHKLTKHVQHEVVDVEFLKLLNIGIEN